MEKEKLPYRAEYAKSGRSSCKKCKDSIAKDSIRLAVMVQSPFFDGVQPNWHHLSCFFERYKPKHVCQFEHIDSLRWDDQETIKKKIENSNTNCVSEASTSENGKNSKSKKRKKVETATNVHLRDYLVTYAKSGKSKCKVCEEFIDKNAVRISKKDYESEVAVRYGPVDAWHHIKCFLKAREELEFFDSADALPGFKDLSPDDQALLMTELPKITKPDTTDGPSPSKRPKENNVPKHKAKTQNEQMFKYHDQLELLTKNELGLLLTHNNQEIPEGISRILERLSDYMTFGALKKCEKCNGQLVFRTGVGYVCLGYVSEWLKCEAVYKNPPRVPFEIPEELKEEYAFLKKYRGKVGERLFEEVVLPEKKLAVKTEKKGPILDGLKVFIHKTESKAVGDLKAQVENLGGSVVKSFGEDVVAVISTNTEVSKSKLAKAIKLAQKSKIHVLPDNFFDEITTSTSRQELIDKMNDKKISSWGSDLASKIKEERITKSVYPSKSVSPSKSLFKSNETVKKVTLKDGLVVDPDSKLEKIAHVYRKGNDIYSAALSVTDVQSGRNSYYKIQVLESDKKHKYWLFRAWGRIGTVIGGNKCEEYETLESCIEIFKDHFQEKTGNAWEQRKNFKKVPGKMMMLDLEYKDEVDKVEEAKLNKNVGSKILSKSVQELMFLIFDVETMKKTMLEFELDLTKMPIGKLSQKQIHKAFGILTELQNFVNTAAERSQFIEKTNMFYTLIPHDCGINVPPILDNLEIIKEKIDMLNSLMDIEIAYKLLQECEGSDNSVDGYYKKLNAKITDLDESSDEFKLIETYVKNTHAKTHMNYTLEIQNVFKVERNGEARRYKKFSKLPNRKLLWHGSRVSNFAGILSQGLRIAPSEAPVTGYMFGKGIYFADMVSKSANYCNTSKKNPVGLILLCEVALGEMHELTKADYIEKLPPGKNSVKGLGKTCPNPSEAFVSPTGVEIPLGKGVNSDVKTSSLLYNEYIVYDTAQVKINYLLRLKFNHK